MSPRKADEVKWHLDPLGLFFCSSMVDDSFAGVVFGVLQPTSSRKELVHHGWEFLTLIGLKTAFVISPVCDSSIDLINIAHLAFNLPSLIRKVPAMVHNTISVPVLVNQAIHWDLIEKTKKKQKPCIKFKPFQPIMLTSYPAARRIPVPLKVSLQYCST